jgi:hypothetical protein
LTVLLRNPRAIETFFTLAALYMHLYQHSQFIISFTRERLARLEKKVASA